MTNSYFTHPGLEAVALFTKSLDQSINGTGEAADFDCVFMDREMPVMCGVEATQLIVEMQKGLRAPVPVVGVSASVKSPENWKAVGMSHLLGKPFSRKDLGRVLRLIESRRADLAKVRHPKLQKSYSNRRMDLGRGLY
jgi:CheY-like chemotaxis protein